MEGARRRPWPIGQVTGRSRAQPVPQGTRLCCTSHYVCDVDVRRHERSCQLLVVVMGGDEASKSAAACAECVSVFGRW